MNDSSNRRPSEEKELYKLEILIAVLCHLPITINQTHVPEFTADKSMLDSTKVQSS